MLRFGMVGFVAWAIVLHLSQPATAQAVASGADTQAVLRVEGTVQQTFRAEGRFDETRLVQLALHSVQLADPSGRPGSLRYPSLGEVIFVVVDQPAESGRDPRRSAPSRFNPSGPGIEPELPAVGSVIRAELSNSAEGIWSAAGRDWFETLQSSPGDRDQRDPTSPEPHTVTMRGMACKPVLVQGQLGLRVETVTPGGPAKQAGFEPGDVIIALDSRPLTSAAEAERAAASASPMVFSVVDVNNPRRVVPVTVQPESGNAPPQDPGSTTRQGPAAAQPDHVGLTVEPVRVGLRRAVKVTTVQPGLAGAAAGLEVNDVILAVDGQRTTSAEEFQAALPSTAGTVKLTVRDSRSGREVPVDLTVASSSPSVGPRVDPSPPTRQDSETSAAAGQLGVRTVLTFYKAEAAVKVVDVAPASPASRVGIRPGWIILKADGNAVLHPDDLAKAEQRASRRIRLQVVNPSGQESTVDVEL